MMWLIVSATCCILLILRLMWSRRRFYYLSSKLNGPIGWPLIGSSLEFSDSSNHCATGRSKNCHRLDHASITNFSAYILEYVVNTVLKLIRTYGSPGSIWMGGNFIVYFDRPEEIEAVLTSLIDKADFIQCAKLLIGGDGLFTINGEDWKFHRKVLSPLVQNYNMLNSYYPSFNKNVRVMVGLLENKVGKGSFDIYHSFAACTMDMVSETTFGVASNIQGGENLSFLENLNKAELIIGALIFQPWYQLYTIFRLSKYYEIAEKSRSETRLYVKKILHKKIEEFESRNRNGAILQKRSNEFENVVKRPVKSFIDELIRLSMEQKCLSEEEIITEAYTMIVGGFETGALTVSYIVLMLALHPEYQEKVFQELRDIFPEQRSDVTAEDIAKFQYTDQFIKESMRYLPTVPFMNRSVKKDLKIGEHTIPAGTELLISIISLHRNPIVWGEKADSFDPDHFLPEACRKRHPYAYIHLLLVNEIVLIRIMVAWIVRNYRFTTDLKMEELRFKYIVSMKLAQHHMVHIHKRENY